MAPSAPTSVSISVSGSGYSVTWSGSAVAATSWEINIYSSTTETGTYGLLMTNVVSTASVTSGTASLSDTPTNTYWYIATVRALSPFPNPSNLSSQATCTPVQYYDGTPITSTINLTMSCLSTIFSTYGGAARGYSLQSYSSIRFSDGSYGPASPPISMSSFLNRAAYSGGTSSTFVASGTYSFTVPTGITSIDVQLWGGYTTQSGAGYGGYVSGTLITTPGETLGILVNIGGGAAGGPPSQAALEGAGRAAIQRSSVDVVTAGGGGGKGFGAVSVGGVGGLGGGLVGGAGGNGTNCTGGGGGTQSAAGAGGSYSSASGNNGSAGSGYVGGTAAAGVVTTKPAGGGGGGYYGGGGGGYSLTDVAGGGGGGGSSYISTLVGTVVNSQGGNSTINGGQIILTWPGTPVYTLLYTASPTYDFGIVAVGGVGSIMTVNVYSDVQTFEVLADGVHQSPPVYLTVSDSSSRTLSLSGSAFYSVISTSPDNTTVQVDFTSALYPHAAYTTTATVGGTMTSGSNTFSYSYAVAISATPGPAI